MGAGRPDLNGHRVAPRHFSTATAFRAFMQERDCANEFCGLDYPLTVAATRPLRCAVSLYTFPWPGWRGICQGNRLPDFESLPHRVSQCTQLFKSLRLPIPPRRARHK